MAKKGQTFQPYTEEFKHKAVMMYVNQGKIYQVLANELRLRSPTQLKYWVKKHRFFGRKASIIQQNRLNRVFKTNKPNQCAPIEYRNTLIA
ncbi:transposase [Bacillus mycoides]|uniref:transposase n=1 Tax=Bacillus mycoides TaxID=1405 RepID=UPI002111CEAD|nr:transposase [Bacillus mycoides]MCQ6530919.1 transposase [Bacillus mycoides]